MFVLDENTPREIAPLAWMLGQWRGWGVIAGSHAAPATPDTSGESDQNTPATSADSDDVPDQMVIEEITCEAVGTQMRMVTRIYSATSRVQSLDPSASTEEGLAALVEQDLINEETVYVSVMPTTQELPPPGQFQTRELTASGADQKGLATLWAGVSMGPRVRMISDAIARSPRAQPVEEASRMFGLVAGELMWAQGVTMVGAGESITSISGRLMRIDEGDAVTSDSARTPSNAAANHGGVDAQDSDD